MFGSLVNILLAPHWYILLRNHSFSTYTTFFKELALLTPWYAQVRVRIRGYEMLVFRENFAYVLNEGSLNWWKLLKIWLFLVANFSLLTCQGKSHQQFKTFITNLHNWAPHSKMHWQVQICFSFLVLTEAVSRDVLWKNCSEKIHKFHRETLVMEKLLRTLF